ncbi:MAG: phage baseplate assembly protein V [Anaerolineae bacterium]
MAQNRQYFGKYRGTVINNIDPLLRGRLQVSVPAVLGDNVLNWAMPSVPYAGNQVGMYFIPPVGANIWVEFEGGDPNSPIWTGCFWGDGEVPAPVATPFFKVLKTETVTITIDEAQTNAITIETSLGVKIMLNATGITIDTGQGSSIQMMGPQVNINNGALEVM